MKLNPPFLVGEEVFIVLTRCDRIDKLCPHCKGERPRNLGWRCIYCQGYTTVFDRTETVSWPIGPVKINAMHVVVTEEGADFTYCVERTFDDRHKPENIFRTLEESREAIESSRVHLQQALVVPV